MSFEKFLYIMYQIWKSVGFYESTGDQTVFIINKIQGLTGCSVMQRSPVNM